MAAITTDQELQQEVGTLASGDTSSVPQVSPVLQNVDPSELESTANKMLQQTAGATVTAASTQGLTPAPPTPSSPTVGQVGSIDDVTSDLQAAGPMQAAQITQPVEVDMTGVQGQVSAGAIGTAATQQLDPQATTQYQLSQLMNSVQQGQPLPPWASPAVRKITGVMQARGLSGSSMAAAAMTQAVLESGVVIASQDANKYATIQLQNLKNEQQMALANAATYAAMDKANLNARLTAAVTNAQSLLAVETKNLDAQQQANTLSYNALTQGIFKDAAEENARQQFNAKNELQVEQFFAELGSQVETANANRIAAMEQFNVSEENAMSQFNATLSDARDKFNANMQYAVDQSNVQWRRQINTANTAVQNETNRINTQNAFNASQNALNNLWQKYRDVAAWNFQKSESALQRQHEVGIMAMEFANTQKLYSKQQKDALAAGIGNWIATWVAS
tara:strand:+ start:41 stop:1387 length:1347 start_codon:yes stop_codon:yes gene_type:complete